MTNEKRLIDANALKRFVCETCNALNGDEPCEPSDCRSMSLIDEMPTVDAVEVVHGHWIEKRLDNFRKWELRCSECGWIGISNYDAYDEPYDFNYCPNCGADMRERSGVE